MNKSESIKSIANSLGIFQGLLHAIKADNENTFFKGHKYTDLKSIWESIKEPLGSCGLSVTQLTTVTSSGEVCLETVLMHTNGEWISGTYPLITKDNSPQALGSALTYARRYTLTSLLGLYQEDDDGEAAMGRGKPAREQAAHSPPANVVPANRPRDGKGNNYITEPQQKRFYRIAFAKGKGFQDADKWLSLMFKVKDASGILSNQYDLIINRLEGTLSPLASVNEPPPILDEDLLF